MGNSSTTELSSSEVVLQKLPSGTAWSFQKCVVPQDDSAKKNVKKKTPKKGKEEGPAVEIQESDGIKVFSLELQKSSKEYQKSIELIEKMGIKDVAVNKITATLNPTLSKSKFFRFLLPTSFFLSVFFAAYFF